MTVKEKIKQALEGHEKLHLSDLDSKLDITPMQIRVVLSTSIGKNEGIFERVGRGYYRLASTTAKPQEPAQEEQVQEKSDSLTLTPVKPESNNRDVSKYIPQHNGYIPNHLPEFGMTDVQLLEKLYNERNQPMAKYPLLIGETGCGKTHLARNLAYKLKVPYMRVNLNGATVPEDLVGQMIPSQDPHKKLEWVDGVLTTFMKKGGILVVDEPNMAPADILSILHSVCDDEHRIVLTQKDGSVVFAHKDFFLIATMNPDTYEGTKPLNLALKDRLRKIYLKYNTTVEKKLGVSDAMMKATKMLRKSTDIETPVSTRDLVTYATDIKIFGEKVARQFFINNFNVDDNEANVVKETLTLCLDGVEPKKPTTEANNEAETNGGGNNG